MCLKRKTTSKFRVGITYKKRNFIIHPEYFDANNIFSHIFIQNLKYKPNIFQDLSIQKNIVLKNRDWRKVSDIKYTKYNASLAGMVKQNTMEGQMQKTKFY